MASVPLGKAVAWIDGALDVKSFRDNSNNGLQIDAGRGEVSKIAFGVDASVRFLEAAAAAGAQLAVCHHGISWGGGIRTVSGGTGAAVRAALEGGVSLYAVHLPLDASAAYGNNFTMARALGLENLAPAYPYSGAPIGCCGTSPVGGAEFLEKVRETVSPCAAAYCGRIDRLAPGMRVGVCSGGGGFAIPMAKEAGHDVLLTGEFLLQDYVAAENAGQCVVAAGHYRTEKWGVRALAAAMRDALGVETEFADFDLPF